MFPIYTKGETFQTPERVPFRLTQNMVEAMGPLGIEGVFRRSCEITMNLFRQHKDIFLSVLRPFLFDPLVEWKDASGGSKGYMPCKYFSLITQFLSKELHKLIIIVVFIFPSRSQSQPHPSFEPFQKRYKPD